MIKRLKIDEMFKNSQESFPGFFSKPTLRIVDKSFHLSLHFFIFLLLCVCVCVCVSVGMRNDRVGDKQKSENKTE